MRHGGVDGFRRFCIEVSGANDRFSGRVLSQVVDYVAPLLVAEGGQQGPVSGLQVGRRGHELFAGLARTESQRKKYLQESKKSIICVLATYHLK